MSVIDWGNIQNLSREFWQMLFRFGTFKSASRFLSRTLCSRWRRRLKTHPAWRLKDNLLCKHAHQILCIQLKSTGLRFAYASSAFKSVIECYCVDAWIVIIVNTILECWLSMYKVVTTKHSYQYVYDTYIFNHLLIVLLILEISIAIDIEPQIDLLFLYSSSLLSYSCGNWISFDMMHSIESFQYILQ